MECSFTDIGCHANWLSNELDNLLDKAINSVLDLGASAVALIPIPDALLQPISFASVPANTIYFLDAFAFQYGVGIVASAYLTRFLIRRLPFIG